VSLLLFAQNLLETAAAVTVSPAAAAAKPLTRLYDRIRGLQYEGGSAAQTDIDIDLGATPPAVTSLAILGHNITGVTISIRADASSPGTSEKATILATGADALVTFSSLSLRHWRVRIPAMANAPKIGELLLGVPRTIARAPFYRDAGRHTVGNVVRRRTPGGLPCATRLGPARVRYPYRWPAMELADLTELRAAYGECGEGVKNLLLRDPELALQWVSWEDEALEPTPVLLGGRAQDIAATFEGAA
jgi:hypothetical protein